VVTAVMYMTTDSFNLLSVNNSLCEVNINKVILRSRVDS